jgi:hypothetical protein
MPTDESKSGGEGNAPRPAAAPSAITGVAPAGGRRHTWRRRLLLGGIAILVVLAHV